MALSNIFREPRREITESAVGLGIFGVYAYGIYHAARWFNDITGGSHHGMPIALAMLLTFFASILACMLFFLIIVATHALGDGICNALQKQGIHLRPRNRPAQR